MPKKSVLTNLMQLSICITEALEEGYQVDAVYIDLAKAFDSVNHAILVGKLQKFGIGGSFLAWLKSYLSNRIQIVSVNGNYSQPFLITSEVAQGSRLGPLLFDIFINDAVSVVQYSKIDLFADDCRIYMKVKNECDAGKLQTDIHNISNWLRLNKLSINESKNEKITFSRKSDMIKYDYQVLGLRTKEVDRVRDLGVILDRQWNFNHHLNMVISKAKKSLGFIKRITSHFSSVDVIGYLFKSLVLPYFTYASVIWSPYTQSKFDRLNGIIKKFLRYLSFKPGAPMSFDDHNYGSISERSGIY